MPGKTGGYIVKRLDYIQSVRDATHQEEWLEESRHNNMMSPAELRRITVHQPTRIISPMPGKPRDRAYPSHNDFYPPCSAYSYY